MNPGRSLKTPKLPPDRPRRHPRPTACPHRRPAQPPGPARPPPPAPPAPTVPPLPPGPPPQPRQTPAPAGPAEPQVLVAEVTVTGAPADLEREIYRVITTQPGRTTNRSKRPE